MSLRLQLLLLQALIDCLVVLATGIVAATLSERQMREAYLDRMIGVALSVAGLPAIKDAFDDVDPAAVIQPIAEVIREASNVTYVVVTDVHGFRFSHTEPLRIGEMVSTDHSIPLAGDVFVGTQTGTLGESWRIKVPVGGPDDAVIGTVSVGILESSLREEFVGGLWGLVLALVAAALIGIFGAAAVTAFIRRRIYRLEPTEIASLVGSRDKMLHGLSEGIVSVDATGRITLANDAARELLALPASGLAGTRASEVLDASLVAVLEHGESEGQLVLAGERILVARSTGNELDGRAVGGDAARSRSHRAPSPPARDGRSPVADERAPVEGARVGEHPACDLRPSRARAARRCARPHSAKDERRSPWHLRRGESSRLP